MHSSMSRDHFVSIHSKRSYCDISLNLLWTVTKFFSNYFNCLLTFLLLATLSLFPAYFLFHCFIFHSVSKSFLAERDMFPVQICINHFYNRIFIAHRLDQYRYFSISQKRSSSFSRSSSSLTWNG